MISSMDTTVGRDTVASIKRGDVTGSSLMFAPRKTVTRDLADEKTGSKTVIVERTDVRLLDVGPVTYPAYKATEASMRSMPDEVLKIRSEIDQDKALADLAEIELALMRAEEDMPADGESAMPAEDAPSFAVGDRVKMTDADGMEQAGEVGEVVGEPVYSVTLDDGTTALVAQSNLQPEGDSSGEDAGEDSGDVME